MTLSSLTSRVDYIGDGATTVFAYAFRIFDANDLTVIRTVGGVETTLTYGSDYTVSGVGNRTGGSVTFTAAPAVAAGIAILRVLDYVQPTNLANLGRYSAEEIEKGLDRLEMQIQQVSEVNDRTMTLPISADPALISAVLPAPVANQILMWNPTATAVTSGTVATGAIVVPAAGRTVTTATAYLANNAVFNVLDYGAVGNGIADDYAAIMLCFNAALADGGNMHFPPGDYRITQNLVFLVAEATNPISVTISGLQGMSRIVPSAAVTIALTLSTASNTDGNTAYLKVTGLSLDGVNTTNATGFLIGGNFTSANITLEDCQSLRFTGATGRGLHINNAVSCRYIRSYFARSGTNVYIISPTEPALPTVQSFQECQFREGGYTTGHGGAEPGHGVDLQQGYRIIFDSACVFEANRGAGVSIVPSAGTRNVLYCQVSGWFEGNQVINTAIPTYDPLMYHINLDGTAAGTVMVRLQGINFNGGARAIYAKQVNNFVIDDCLPSLNPNQIVIDTNVAGYYTNWPWANAPFATVATNASVSFRGVFDYMLVEDFAAAGEIMAGTFQSLGLARFGAEVIGTASGIHLLLQPNTGGQGALRTAAGSNLFHWDTVPIFDVAPTAGEYKVATVKVVGPRGAAVADVASANATDLATALTLVNELKAQVNTLLARLRSTTGHGLFT